MEKILLTSVLALGVLMLNNPADGMTHWNSGQRSWNSATNKLYYSIGELDHLCQQGKFELFKRLCKSVKVDPRDKDADGNTLLHIACKWGQLEVVRYLCEKQHLNLEADNLAGETPLCVACKWGQLEVVRYLCEEQNVNTEAADYFGMSPLWVACSSGELEVGGFHISNVIW